MTSYPSSHHRLQGFTLLEALIALLVLSIGLLGIAGMQLKALQGAHMAYQRSLASVIAIDAQERLWAGRASGTCPSNSETETISNKWADFWFDEPHDDLETLPGGDKSNIAPVAGTLCTYTITVDWSEERLVDEEGKDEDLSSFTYQLSLPK